MLPALIFSPVVEGDEVLIKKKKKVFYLQKEWQSGEKNGKLSERGKI